MKRVQMYVSLGCGGAGKGLPQDTQETDMTHRQMEVYKGKRGDSMLG